MSGYENLLKTILSDPFEVWASAINPQAAIFLSDPLVGPTNSGVRTIVNYRALTFDAGSTSGLIVTAYPIDTARYPHPRIGRLLKKR